MTGITRPIVVRIRNGQAKEISDREVDRIEAEVNKMFGMTVINPQAFQKGLDLYCQRHNAYPLILADLIT